MIPCILPLWRVNEFYQGRIFTGGNTETRPDGWLAAVTTRTMSDADFEPFTRLGDSLGFDNKPASAWPIGHRKLSETVSPTITAHHFLKRGIGIEGACEKIRSDLTELDGTPLTIFGHVGRGEVGNDRSLARPFGRVIFLREDIHTNYRERLSMRYSSSSVPLSVLFSVLRWKAVAMRSLGSGFSMRSPASCLVVKMS